MTARQHRLISLVGATFAAIGGVLAVSDVGGAWAPYVTLGGSILVAVGTIWRQWADTP